MSDTKKEVKTQKKGNRLLIKIKELKMYFPRLKSKVNHHLCDPNLILVIKDDRRITDKTFS